jgi:hypothetical protein
MSRVKLAQMAWEGPERRSPESLMARAVIAAKQEAERLEKELAGTSLLKRGQRTTLKKAIEEARRRERDALFVLRNG